VLIQHCTYGGWQGALEVLDCLEGCFKLFRLDLAISLIQQVEAGQLALIAAIAPVIRPAIPAFFSHKGTLHSLTEWLLSCTPPRVLAPILYRPDSMALSPLSPGGPTATSNKKFTFVLLDPWLPHHSLSGGWPLDTITGTCRPGRDLRDRTSIVSTPYQ
jgi:hypothetical protein